MSVNYVYGAWSTGEDMKFNEDGAYLPSHGDQPDFNDCNKSEVSVPAWESDPVEWDYENAEKLAKKLFLLDSFGEKIPNETYDLTSYDQLCNGSSGMGINPRFKTEFCRNFREKGVCQYGEHCQFAHGKGELRPDVVRHSKYKTKLCQKFWIAGYCAYGARCNFIHQQEESYDGRPANVGLRPFHPNFRKTSESSIDSGVESGLSQPKYSKMISPPSDSIWREPRTTISPPRRYSDFNLNVVTDMNSNMNQDCIKGFYRIPHPEYNPIQPTNEKLKDLDYYRSCEAGIWNTPF